MNVLPSYSQAGGDINTPYKQIKQNLDECERLINEIDALTVAVATTLVVKMEAA